MLLLLLLRVGAVMLLVLARTGTAQLRGLAQRGLYGLSPLHLLQFVAVTVGPTERRGSRSRSRNARGAETGAVRQHGVGQAALRDPRRVSAQQTAE